MNLIITFSRCLSSNKKRPKNSGLNRESNPDLCDAGAVLHQLSYEANWEQVIVWVDYNSIKCFHYKHIICGLMKPPHYDLHPVGLTAQLVEHCTGIAEVRVQISIQAENAMIKFIHPTTYIFLGSVNKCLNVFWL